MEKAREFQKNIYFCFIDYAKAFDCVDLYWIKAIYGKPITYIVFSREKLKAFLLVRESIPRQVDKKPRVPEEEKEVWGSQGGDRGLEFSRKRKGQTFFFYVP